MSQNKSKSRWIIYRPSCLNKKRKAAINQINKKDNKCFQYTVTLTLDHAEIKIRPTNKNKVLHQ